jgi:hypothetical protein
MSETITIEISEVDSSTVNSSIVGTAVDSSIVGTAVDSSIADSSIADSSIADSSIVNSSTLENSITIEINTTLKGGGMGELLVLPPPNPLVELMRQHSKIALLIGLNYVDFPEITLKNRIKVIHNAKQILINLYGFTEENIIVLFEPSREKVLTMLNTILGSSNLINELIIYYSGYGNGIMKTYMGFCGETGIIDNLAKQIMPADFEVIGQNELTTMLNNSCCKTVCIMDMCPYGNDNMLLKWGADINNQVKIITLCESDSHNTNKNEIIQSMLREHSSLINPPSF